jgi:uncharacterized protein YecE (DUF72 family)
MAIHIGIGGWVYEPWRDNFYPKGLPQRQELEYAGSRLTAIEINGTYYGSQKPASFRKWHDETPEGFVFAVKGPRFATNRRVLAEAGPSIEKFFASGVDELKDKLGPVNWQFLPHKKFEAEDFESFLRLLPRSSGGQTLRHAVEVRHPSFQDPDFVALCRRHKVAIITGADSEFPMIADVTGDFVYARIMGTEETQKLGYAPVAIRQWAARAATWSKGGTPADLPLLAAAPGKQPRDVFLFVIGGAKAKNPLAAQSLIAALEQE